MAFMRGKYYVWEGGDGIHLPDVMPMVEFDALVIMRMAELISIEKKALPKAIKKAMEYRGNFGCDALCKLQGKQTAQEFLDLFVKTLKKKKKEVNKNDKVRKR
jgi:hypothetical protein